MWIKFKISRLDAIIQNTVSIPSGFAATVQGGKQTPNSDTKYYEEVKNDSGKGLKDHKNQILFRISLKKREPQ